MKTTQLRTLAIAALAALVCTAVGAAEEPQTWDGLTRMKAKRMDAVFDAGSATLAVEVRDSQTRQLLGRAVDARTTPGTGTLEWTTSVSNRADFQQLFSEWARIVVNGLDDLKEGAQPKPVAGK
jgi:hypothetical protein